MTDKKDKPENDNKWSTPVKVGAAVGSAALVAALLYAGKRSLSKREGGMKANPPKKTVKKDDAP